MCYTHNIIIYGYNNAIVTLSSTVSGLLSVDTVLIISKDEKLLEVKLAKYAFEPVERAKKIIEAVKNYICSIEKLCFIVTTYVAVYRYIYF